MTNDIDAIFDQGVFRPLGPLALPNGTRVHLRVEEENLAKTSSPSNRILSPRLAHPEQAALFTMEVREATDAGI